MAGEQGPGAGATDLEIRELAREILSRSEYARWRPENALYRLFERIDAWLETRWDELVAWLPDWAVNWIEAMRAWLEGFGVGAVFGGRALSSVEWIVGLLILTLIVVGFYALAKTLRRHLAPAHGAVAGERGVGVGDRLPLSDAHALASTGRFLEAAHQVQLASLKLLLERRSLDLSRSEPNRTLRHRLARAPLPEIERTDFVSLLDRLEAHWFRDREDDRELYQAWCGLHARLRALGDS